MAEMKRKFWKTDAFIIVRRSQDEECSTSLVNFNIAMSNELSSRTRGHNVSILERGF